MSLRNSAEALGDRLYGTQERANGTMMVAFLMSALGVLLHTTSAFSPVCAM